MKNIVNIIYFMSISVLISACDSYFENDPEQGIDTNDAYNTVQDIQNGLNGAYNAFAYYGLYGNYAVAIGDFASDNAVADQSKGHFVAINQYTMNETSDELDFLWNYGYKVIDRTTRAIIGANALLENGGLNEEDESDLNSYLAQCYGLRAMAAHALVCAFGLPYGTDNNAQGGIVVINDKPIDANDKVSRSSVVDTYSQILLDISSAKTYFTKSLRELDQFYLTEAGIFALEARVALHMGKYALAAEAASTAITLRNSGDVSDLAYISMWSSLAITDEDIFTLAKTQDDNLSANALNTLYGSYGGLVTLNLIAQFNATDIRLGLINKSNRPLKFAGIPDAAAVSNIPIFRKSEMYLIIAEAKTQQSAISEAQEALFYTAKRDKSITAYTQLPSDKDQLLTFIAKERRRELFQEGFRWYDARRTGELISVYNGRYTNYDVSKFVYPIPSDEINAGAGTEQNDTWSDNLPK